MTDWTYDLFNADAEQYTALESMKQTWGCSRRDLMEYLKTAAQEFISDWMKSHKGLYDRADGYIGDAFGNEILSDGWFSDFYKDVYGQRPHLPIWFYVRVTGLPQQEDTIRLFCDDPIDRAVENAKWVRDNF